MLKNLEKLERAIVRTIFYYDIFDYPLTSFELWTWLLDYKCSLYDVENCLSNSANIFRYIESKDSFYFIKGRRDIIKIRKDHRDFSIIKWKKALKIVNRIKFLPFVKMVALCNSIGYFNLNKESDIDLFIIIRGKYIWFSRFFITLIVQLSGVRRHGKKIEDRICLSFYITDENLNIENLQYKNDIYFYYWMIHLMPIFGYKTYIDFMKKNIWVKDRIFNFEKNDPIDSFIVSDSRFSKNFRLFLEKILDNFLGISFNLLLKNLQLAKMSFKRNIVHDDKDVVINDNILKFHENDRRKYYRDIFLKKINNK
ncbi:MAG: hypothetical protein PHZ07_01625 [Patescibacteria group bacterium]|nr:hypothetical protein [Patescibacteria group bacterium]MDD4303867.1 hypothetical protein [Patescibacteria group bacterium]MDD4695146.1 hypothetical protein [Patescibacteria group bacterium]